jgi:signal transduction histidine kinase
VLQEALQNAVRHSGAARFAVSLESTSDVLTLTVRDGGCGFSPESVPQDHGLGLTSMRERLKLVAGELVIDSKPDNGTAVVARVPLRSASLKEWTPENRAPLEDRNINGGLRVRFLEPALN